MSTRQVEEFEKEVKAYMRDYIAQEEYDEALCTLDFIEYLIEHLGDFEHLGDSR